MRQLWSTEELVEGWSLGPEDLGLLPRKIEAGKLGFAVQLAYYRRHARFPEDEADLAPAVIAHLANQIGVPAAALDTYDWAGRTGRRHRQAILEFLAVKPFEETAEAEFCRWLTEEALPREPSLAALEEEIEAWFARDRIARPGAYRLDRIVRSARTAHDERAFQAVARRLDGETRSWLDALLTDADG